MSKRFLYSGMLILALLTSAWGSVLAATFCPRALGREGCFAMTHKHSSRSIHENMAVHNMHMDDMSMAGMNMGDMAMDAPSTDHMAMNDKAIDAVTVDMSIPWSPPASSGGAVANKFDQPIESCAHCLGHSGIVNAPVPFVSVSDQSGKETSSLLLPVSRFLIGPAIVPAQSGLPREHAPPGVTASLHILISVFQI
jgi:hypothetical protein